MRRLIDSCRVYRMEPQWSQDELSQAVLDTVRVNGFKSCYIRPLVYRGYDSLTLDPRPCPVDASVVVWEWNLMMGADALEQRHRRRRQLVDAPGAEHAAGARQGHGQLRQLRADQDAGDARRLRRRGRARRERPAQRRQRPEPVPGARQRDLHAVARLVGAAGHHARDRHHPRQGPGLHVRETAIPREFLYLADEAFFCGTAVEITPIRSFDRIIVGNGKRGPITEALQQRFFGILSGEPPDTHRWLTPVRDRFSAASRLLLRRPVVADLGGSMHVNDLLKLAVEKGASDLHLKVGSYPDGPHPRPPVAPSPRKSTSITRTWSRWPRRSCRRRSGRSSRTRRKSTSPTASPGLGRFRCNVFQQRGTIGVVLRVIPVKVMTLDELSLPPVLKKIAAEERGLVLVTGTTGSGKSTTLAGDDRSHQHEPHRAHHHDRRSDRVPAPRQPVHHQPARDRRRHAVVRLRAAQRAAPGSRTSSWSAKCATWKRSRPRCTPPRPATWCSRRCTRSMRPRPSTASSRCSRRTSRSRSACSSRRCSRRRSPSA